MMTDIRFSAQVGSWVSGSFLGMLKEYCFVQDIKLQIDLLRDGLLQKTYGITLSVPSDAVERVLREIKAFEY